ncbi:unnamed protein product [Linum tenue]|uniref:Uncharacterized protein n=1 Tax=Linum tenue TaxID=586396 RepID=A0AAV0MKN4_9ROSI|nr:unnamed protein product [Linum tenue]
MSAPFRGSSGENLGIESEGSMVVTEGEAAAVDFELVEQEIWSDWRGDGRRGKENDGRRMERGDLVVEEAVEKAEEGLGIAAEEAAAAIVDMQKMGTNANA